MVRQLLFSCYQRELYRDLESSTDAQLAAIAAKAVKEVSYHVEHASTWVLRLGDGTELSHDRTQAALDAVWPYSHELFADDELARRIADLGRRPAAVRAAAGLAGSGQDVLTEATLSLPADGWQALRRPRRPAHRGIRLPAGRDAAPAPLAPGGPVVTA